MWNLWRAEINPARPAGGKTPFLEGGPPRCKGTRRQSCGREEENFCRFSTSCPQGKAQLCAKRVKRGTSPLLLHKLVRGGNPSTEAKERLPKQGYLPAELGVVAHLALDLGASMNDG